MSLATLPPILTNGSITTPLFKTNVLNAFPVPSQGSEPFPGKFLLPSPAGYASAFFLVKAKIICSKNENKPDAIQYIPKVTGAFARKNALIHIVNITCPFVALGIYRFLNTPIALNILELR